MAENHIEGEVLSCLVIPDYHNLYRHEWTREHVITRYDMLHLNPPLLKCFCKKEYLNNLSYEKRVDQLDFKIDKDLCEELKPTHLAFIAFDKISVAKKLKDLIT